MIWAAFDPRLSRGCAEHGLEGPVERWELVRAQLGDEIERLGFDAERGH